ncbi:MAG: site-2 protease family protein [Dictyoglomus thermophilum]|uniref:Site-2 protease family protein n=1 Tax=Dictyoglomus thermophilum TaxID=14 RepID=A0A7C2H4R3_DICTH|nr:site-2 protease family protein [Dictyoglomus thermophilum]MCX7719904.1 site-2 protease family protein [Dictyoglomus thermophilum]TYT22647.1 site-2 protease family protein [Dictyoglomus thermophilum]
MEFSDIVTYLWRIVAILIAITVHEFAHGKMADIEGDITPRLSGRLTLNPLAHIDPIGFLMLLFFRFGWAKPVPVNFNNLRRGEKSIILVSLAGPLANFILAFLVSIFWRIDLPLPLGFIRFCIELAILNVFLGIFNLIPIPPLDGSHILESILPYKYRRYYQSISLYGVLILMVLILTNGLYIIISPFLNLFLYLLGLK